MGYVLKPRVLRMVWPEGHDLHGLEIRAGYPTFARLERYLTEDNNDQLIDMLIEHVVSWNRTDESGAPVAFSREALTEFPPLDVREIINTWWDTVSGKVATPLDEPSVSSTQSGVHTLPMEAL